jgi:hypothetical protein
MYGSAGSGQPRGIKNQTGINTLDLAAAAPTYAEIIEIIKKVLEENYIAVDCEGSSLLSEAKEEIINLKQQLSDSIAEKIVLNERQEKIATYLLISESTNGLSPEQKKRVSDMFKDKPFSEAEAKIKGFVEFICESEVKKGTTVDNTSPAPASADGVILENVIGDIDTTPKPEPTIPENSDLDVINRADRYMR